MNLEQLESRFSKLWRDCGGSDPAPVWQALREHYLEPHRHYHTLNHLAHCFTELDAARDHIAEFRETEMAIWFHDVIYVYGASDNEARSAEYFRQAAGGEMDPSFADRVCEFILATRHTGEAPDEATAFMVDIDLSGFGLPWEGYLADSAALREEAPGVSDEQYYRGKLRFFDSLTSWPSLYQTEYFRRRLEASAQSNIQRYSASLRARGFGQGAACRA